MPSLEFDTHMGDPANLLGVVLTKEDGMFNVGTKAGILSGTFSRNQIELTKYKGIKRDAVLQDELTGRSAVRALSVGHGQGFKKCLCTTTFLTKRYSCLKAGM